jgi:hypothetical protein
MNTMSASLGNKSATFEEKALSDRITQSKKIARQEDSMKREPIHYRSGT